MAPPLVSVVVPTFNGSRYIREALGSLRQQTLADWEAIVVDDGSRDGTPALVREFMEIEPRVRLVVHEKNRQLPAALNTGFAQARGRYLTWTADDNLFRPQALDVLSRHLAEYPDVGLVYAAATIVDAQGLPLRHRPAADPHGLHERNPVGWCFMYPARVCREIGDYDPAAFLAEDLDYWLRISMRYRVAAISDDLYLYREHPGSLTETRQQDCRRAAAKVFLRHVPRLPWASRNEKARVLYERMSFFLSDRKPGWAVLSLLRGLRQDPRYFFRRFRQKLFARG